MRIVYTAASGESIDLSQGLIRAVSVSGIFPERSIDIEESGTVGGSFVSERRGVRRIKLRTVICGDIGRSQEIISEIFGFSGMGKLTFSDGGKSIGIGCYSEGVSAESTDGTNYAEMSFLCPNPFFERSGGSEVFVQLCGSSGIWEFDDRELSEGDETELSVILSGNSAFVPNDGGFEAGCIITAEVLSDVSEIRAVNVGTKEFIGVKGDFSAGDIVIFRCIDGEKGIFLSSVRDNAKAEDITHRIIWGSSFFKIAPNGTRIRILTDAVGINISAYISLKEFSEGF